MGVATIAFIYVLMDPRTGAVRYVGWTTNPRKRLAAHIKEAERDGRSHKCRWLSQLAKLGLMPGMEIIETTQREQARSREVFLARQLREGGASLTNGGPGGDLEPWGWNRGLTKESDPRVAKAASALRASMIGNRHGVGRKRTEEEKEKLRLAQLRSWAENPSRRSVWQRHRHPSIGKPSWSRGLTKDTDARIAIAGRKSGLARRGLPPWNKSRREVATA